MSRNRKSSLSYGLQEKPPGGLEVAWLQKGDHDHSPLAFERFEYLSQLTSILSGSTAIQPSIELLASITAQPMSLSMETTTPASPGSAAAAAGDGRFGDLFDWPIIGVHAILTPDNRVFTFGTDQQGMQGGQWVYDVWDPMTNQHQTLENTTQTNLFCGVAAIVPETGEILVSGGDASTFGGYNFGINDVNVFDYQTNTLQNSPLGDMAFQRWYPSIVTLATGQLVILGGIDGQGNGVGTPEIYTPGDGWRELPGAYNIDLAQNWYYPRSWVLDSGKMLYLASDWSNSPVDMYLLDPSRDGSFEHIGQLPFATTYLVPSIRYSQEKVLIMSAGGELWSMDISGDTPTFSQISPGVDLPDRIWSNMVIMADGRVLISGGSAVDAASVLDRVVGAVNTVLIFDPSDNSITTGDEAAVARLYHSTTLLLADGQILSLGGGAPGPVNNLNGEIYTPDYLLNNDGTIATRPTIGTVDAIHSPGDIFQLSVANSAEIDRLTFLRYGSTTHSANLATEFTELAYSVVNATTLSVTLPDNGNFLTPGYWMLFAFNQDGVPSVSTQVRIATSGEHFEGLPVMIAYAGANYSGASQELSVAIHEASLGELSGIGDNQLSSFTIAPGYEVLLATSENPLPEDIFAFTGNVAALPGILDNSVSWIQVRRINTLTNNDAPVATDDHFYAQAGADITIDVLANDIDPNGDALGVFEINGIAMQPGWDIYLDQGGWLHLNSNNTLTFHPYYTFNGSVSFSYGVSDGVTASDHGDVEISIGGTAGNRAPVANNDAYVLNAGSSLAFNPITNDRDPESGSLSLSAINGVAIATGATASIAGGTLSRGTGNTLTFQPTHGYTGTASFAYTVVDSAGKSDTATVTLLVTTDLHNRPPSVQDDNFAIATGGTATINVLANDADYENQPLQVGAINGASIVFGTSVAISHGSVIVNVDGEILFTAEAGYSGTVSFDYTAIDVGGRIGIATVSGIVGNLILGTEEDDANLRGTGADETIRGLGGSDWLFGEGGNDSMEGGAGADYLFGGPGNDTLDGNAAADWLYGGADNDTLNGGAGADLMFGEAGSDIMNGGADGDYMWGGSESDTMHGDDGVDWLRGEEGVDYLYGDAGDDVLIGGSGDDQMWGGTDTDTFYGEDDNDWIYGEANGDVAFGQEGDDHIFGGSEGDFLFGGNGADTINGGTQNDLMWGAMPNQFDGATDTFEFDAGWGFDAVYNFELGVDQVRFNSVAGLTQFSDFTLYDGGTNVTIAFGADAITFYGITQAELEAHSGDFVFV